MKQVYVLVMLSVSNLPSTLGESTDISELYRKRDKILDDDPRYKASNFAVYERESYLLRRSHG